MKMVDVKLPKKTKEELKKEMSPIQVERDRWPYGLQLRFESEQVEKLPQLEKMKIGQSDNVSGIGEVTFIRMNEEKEGKKRYSVEVQIQQVGVESAKGSPETMADAMNRHKKNNTMGMKNED